MSKSKWKIFAVVCAIALGAIVVAPVSAQSQAQAVKPKPPMYGYISNWQIPRAHWAEMKSSAANDSAMLDKAMADGTIIGYGSDENLVHTPDGWTHDDWFASMSMGGLMKILEQYYNTENSTPPVLLTSTKHWDLVLTSRYYNWKPGASYKNGFVSVSSYKLKTDAPDNALTVISGEIVAPLLEKLLADGTLVEYEIDTQAVHTSAPGSFWIVTVVQNPDDLDKVNDAIQATIKAHPIEGVAFGSLTNSKAHRDELGIGTGKFK
ncbi:MAG TPA: hypothetical protein VMU92_11740 [Acidobacteriaceae bacterium]|nr:hypothetical protein [Acidobacteriaceae bacterium]